MDRASDQEQAGDGELLKIDRKRKLVKLQQVSVVSTGCRVGFDESDISKHWRHGTMRAFEEYTECFHAIQLKWLIVENWECLVVNLMI